MTTRRNKNAELIDKTPSIIDHSAQMSQENFVTEFLKHCEENNVEPLPRFVIKNGIEEFATLEPEKELKKDVPVFHVSFENPKRMENAQKLECKGQEVSICILDALNITLEKYNTITVLKLPNCQINAYGVLQIAHMMSEFGCILDVNLDNNPNVQENYYLLCAPTRNLCYLSLKMCKLSDNGMQKIANELRYWDPPNNPKLVALNIAGNDITDIGAKYIAAMLRTNRSLQSVVLTANKIQDEGALLIIQELCMSALTHEEIVDLRRRRFIELESKLDNQQTQEIFITERTNRNETLQNQNSTQSFEKTNQYDSKMKVQTDSPISDSTIQISEKSLDSDVSHPFMRETVAINGCVMTSGNLKLQHLSLSFNRLTNKTLKKLVSCLYYQNYMLLDDSARGLLYVFLEDNDIQKDEDWSTFQELLRRRRQDNQKIPDEDFKDLVPVESEALRNKINNLRI